eukprot:2311750-Amphidinium_carterae.1
MTKKKKKLSQVDGRPQIQGLQKREREGYGNTPGQALGLWISQILMTDMQPFEMGNDPPWAHRLYVESFSQCGVAVGASTTDMWAIAIGSTCLGYALRIYRGV